MSENKGSERHTQETAKTQRNTPNCLLTRNICNPQQSYAYSCISIQRNKSFFCQHWINSAYTITTRKWRRQRTIHLIRQTDRQRKCTINYNRICQLWPDTGHCRIPKSQTLDVAMKSETKYPRLQRDEILLFSLVKVCCCLCYTIINEKGGRKKNTRTGKLRIFASLSSRTQTVTVRDILFWSENER